MNENFKVGDRVVCIKPFCNRPELVSKKGTIVKINHPREIAVMFDDWFEGHDCNGTAGKSGRWGSEDEIEKIDEISRDVCDCLKRNCNTCNLLDEYL